MFHVLSTGMCWVSVLPMLCSYFPNSVPVQGTLFAGFEKITLQNCSITAKTVQIKIKRMKRHHSTIEPARKQSFYLLH